jgi:hypothetical protein
MTVFMVVTALFVLLLAGLVFNQGLSILRKIDLQNQADATALAVGENQASALNQLTLYNHLIGEQLAWAVIPEALAGSNVDRSDLEPSDRREAERLVRQIADLSVTLQLAGQSTPAAATLQEPIESGAMTGQAKIRLLAALVRNYEQRLGSTSSPGSDVELAVLAEWRTLSELEAQGRQCRAAKDYLLSQSIPALLTESDRIVRNRGLEAAGEAQSLGAAHHFQGGLWPSVPSLPVQTEAVDLTDPNPAGGLQDAQIVQAAWPWVLYDRQPVLERLQGLTISSAAALYDSWTVATTARLAGRIYLQTNRALFVLADSASDRKGFEPWTSDSRLADRRFGLMALAYRPAPVPLAEAIFPGPIPEGQLAHTQAMLYNALPNHPEPGDRGLQPRIGWDTLNWSVRVARYPATDTVVLPEVQPGWRARLVPVTLLDDAALDLPGPFQRPVQRLVPIPRPFQNH